ncbi:hypothetical protein NSERUTF1_2796 [Nocardia seriolae]|nr:hypothetical protein NSERUTF1_2796 [Nocardia seriolae]
MAGLGPNRHSPRSVRPTARGPKGRSIPEVRIAGTALTARPM